MFDFVTRNFPSVVFLGIWIVSLLMYKFNPYNYYEINNSTVFLVFLALFSATLGLIVSNLYLRKGHIYVYKEERRKDSIKFNTDSLLIILIALCIGTTIGAFWKLYILGEKAGGMLQYLSNPIIARQIAVESTGKISSGWNLADSFANYLIDFNYFAAIIGGVLFQTKRHRLASYLPIFLGLLVSIITFQRYFFVNNFVFWISTLLVLANLIDFKTKKVLQKQVIKIGISIATIFVIFSFLIVSIRLSFGHKTIDVEEVSAKILESNYSYFAGNIVALDNYYTGQTTLHYGKSLFKDPLKWLARLGLLEESELLKSRSKFTSISPEIRFNTYSFIKRFYEDFGILGVVVLSFIWAALSNYLFFSLNKKFSLLRLYFVAVLIFTFFISFYDFALVNIMLFTYMAFIIITIEHLIYKPEMLYSLETLER